MKRSRGSRLLAAAVVVSAALVPAGVTAAAGKPEVVVGITVMKEVVTRDAQGREQVELAPAETTGKGDTLVYEIRYTNKGDAPATSARVVDPIPTGTRLVGGSWSADNADMTVSVDGGRNFTTHPVSQQVTLADGTKATEQVDPSRYTHLAWTSREPLAPGATRTARFKVVVR